MKKVFSFILVILMIVGIGISIANFTSVDLEASKYQDPEWRDPKTGGDCWKMAWDCDVVIPPI